MALLATQQITPQGLTPAYSAASGGGDSYIPGENTFLHVKNGDSASHTVTIHATATAYGEPITNPTVTIAAGASAFIGPYLPGEVAQANGHANLTYDAVTAVTVAVLTH